MRKRFPPVFKGFSQIVYGGDYNPDQWLDRPDVLREDMRLMRLAHMNSASICIFAWHAIEPEENRFTFAWLDQMMDRLHENGIRVVLSTPSGARPAWLDKKYPQALRTQANRVQNLHGGRENHCYTAPIFREKVRICNEKLAERYARHPALSMWHISNEYNGECHCPLCQEAFRAWLRAKYETVEALNSAWWTGFWSHTFTGFEEIESPAPHGESGLHGLTLDWKRFVTDQTVDFMRAEIAPLRAQNPDIPVTTNLMSLFTQLNYEKIAPYIDVVSWDDYPVWHNDEETMLQTAQRDAFNHDWFRAMRQGQPFMLMESTPSVANWHRVNKLKRPGVLALGAMNAVAHGSDSVQYFQWRKSRGGFEKLHGAVVDHVGHERTRVFREVAALGERLEELRGVSGTSVKAEAAVIWDTENQWAIDDFRGASECRHYTETCIRHHAPFFKQGIPIDVIFSTASFLPYKLVVAPMLYMLRPGVAQRLTRFAQAGGTVVLTYLSGYVDENDLTFLGGFPGDGLMALAGIWAEELDSLHPGDTNALVFGDNRLGIRGTYASNTYCEIIHAQPDTEVLATYGADFYRGMPAMTYHAMGDGGCYFLATRTEDGLLDAFYQKLCEDLSIRRVSDVPLPEGVHAAMREAEGEDYVFYLNFTDSVQRVGTHDIGAYGVHVVKREVT